MTRSLFIFISTLITILGSPAILFAQNTTNIGGVINSYTEIKGFDFCSNKLEVADASSFKVNDTVLLIQMKGAVIDTTNSSTFGTIIDYRSAGFYEINYIKQKSGNTLFLQNFVLHNYNIPQGNVQLVHIPSYKNATVTSPLTAPPLMEKPAGYWHL